MANLLPSEAAQISLDLIEKLSVWGTFDGSLMSKHGFSLQSKKAHTRI